MNKIWIPGLTQSMTTILCCHTRWWWFSLVKSPHSYFFGNLQPSSVTSSHLSRGEDDRFPPHTLVMDVTMTHDRNGRTTQRTNGTLTHADRIQIRNYRQIYTLRVVSMMTSHVCFSCMCIVKLVFCPENYLTHHIHIFPKYRSFRFLVSSDLHWAVSFLPTFTLVSSELHWTVSFLPSFNLSSFVSSELHTWPILRSV